VAIVFVPNRLLLKLVTNRSLLTLVSGDVRVQKEEGVPAPPTCTDEQLAGIARALVATKDYARRAPPVSFETRCPEETWLEEYYRVANITVPTYLGINVGCNKGLDAVSMGRLLSRNEAFESNRWKEGLGEGIDRPACPRPPRDFPVNTGAPRKGRIHCIEPVPDTVGRLKSALHKTGLDLYGLIIAPFVISNSTGMTLFPAGRAGGETSSIGHCMSGQHGKGRKGCVSVSMYTLDDYVSRFVMDGDAPIDVLMVDAEGYDFDILRASEETLKRVKYLEYEVHRVGSWGNQRVVDSVEFLQKHNFTCYWAGKGRLFRVTGCLRQDLVDAYEINKFWSNMACVQNSHVELAKVMEDTFLKTVDVRYE